MLKIMVRNFCYIVIGFILCTCQASKEISTFEKLSRFMEKEARKSCAGHKYFHKARIQLEDTIDFINYDADTIYKLIQYDTQMLWAFYECIWNQDAFLEYRYVGQEVEIEKNVRDSTPHKFDKTDTYLPRFVRRLYGFVERWDTVAIRENEAKYSNWSSNHPIMAQKIILENGRIKDFKCIYFDEFFSPVLDNRW